MAAVQKPSTPSVNGTVIQTNPVPGAVKYNLYRISFIGELSNFILADGKTLLTKDGKTFLVAEPT
jgi:hypothetical protein